MTLYQLWCIRVGPEEVERCWILRHQTEEDRRRQAEWEAAGWTVEN